MIKITNLNKYFNKGKANEIHVINNTSFEFPEKGLVAITGPSGCGKTTLLNVIGGLDKFESGEIDFDGTIISKYKAMDWDIIRNRYVGYIFQNYNLVESKTVYENIEMALNMAGLYNKEAIEKRINYVLTSVGMYNYRRRNVRALSGGQQQRVAIARAIAKNPKVVLADEPTGNLDANNTFEIMSIIKKISETCLVILVSHERSLVDFYADEIIEITDGKIANVIDNRGEKSFEHKDERNIYLKDLFFDDSLASKQIKRYYDANRDDSLKLQIIEVRDSVYIKAESKKKVKYLTDDTEVRLLDEHYKARQAEDVREYSFDLEQFGTIKQTDNKKSFIKLDQSLVSGFKRFIGKQRRLIGKLFLIAYFVISALVAYQIATFAHLTRVETEDFLTVPRNLIAVTSEESLTTADIDNIADNVDNVEWTYYYRAVQGHFLYQDLYQGEAVGSANVYPIKMSNVDPDTLILGDMPTNNLEIVVDRWVLDNLIEEKVFTDLGVTEIADFIGRQIVFSKYYYDLGDEYYSPPHFKFDIVGITDTGSPMVTVTDDAIFSFAFMQENLAQSTAQGRIEIVSGRDIQAVNEVLIGQVFSSYYEGNTYEYRGTTYNIVGTFASNTDYLSTGYEGGLIFPDAVIEDYQRLTLREALGEEEPYYDYYYYGTQAGLYFYSDDIEQAISDIMTYDDKYQAVDAYESQYQSYLDNTVQQNMSQLRTVIVIMVGIIVYIYFMMRTSMLNRIREIGIYRSIGATKRDIYKIFFGEIFALTTIGSLTGYLVMSYLISRVQNMLEGALDVFYLPLHYFLAGIVFLYLINILFGMLPILNLLRKTPSEINAKYDI